ncbi:MAG: hypothetical protein V3T82_08000 [Nitrospinaceae bacterium]
MTFPNQIFELSKDTDAELDDMSSKLMGHRKNGHPYDYMTQEWRDAAANEVWVEQVRRRDINRTQ